jgi:peptide/nickel transport system substrate-binding protein
VIKDIPEAATRLTTLSTGETDLFFQVPFDLVDQLKSAQGIRIQEAATNFWDPLVMNCKKAPFSNPKVRKAVRLCLDKDAVIRIALNGHGHKVILPLLPTDPVYPSQVADLRQNYAQAKSLLSAAGYPNGFTTPMYIGTGRPARERLSELIVDMLKPANIICNIQRMPIDKFFANVESNGELYCDGFPADPGADMHLYPVFHSGGSFDISHWDDPKADALLDQARQTASSAQRRVIYGRFAELLNEEGPMWIPWVQNIVIAHRERVKGFRVWHDFRVWLGETWVS